MEADSTTYVVVREERNALVCKNTKDRLTAVLGSKEWGTLNYTKFYFIPKLHPLLWVVLGNRMYTLRGLANLGSVSTI